VAEALYAADPALAALPPLAGAAAMWVAHRYYR